MPHGFYNFLKSNATKPRGVVECHAEDPSNCKWHHTGIYAPGAKQAEKEDSVKDVPVSAEAELAKIKADKAAHQKGFGGTSLGMKWALELKAQHMAEAKPSTVYSHNPTNKWWEEERKPYVPPKPVLKTVDELQKLIDKADQKMVKDVEAVGNYVDETGKTHKTRISPKTGKPVSKIFNTIMNALMCGIHVSDLDITSTPEWKEAEKQRADYVKSKIGKGKTHFANTWQDVSKDRAKVRDDVFEHITRRVVTPELNDALKEGESYEVKKGFRLDIVMGVPGSGKNYSFADRISVENHSRLADADIVKRLLPGYDDGLGAPDVHDESTFINKDLLDFSMKKGDPLFGDNLVYQTMGSSFAGLRNRIDEAHDAGYKVYLHFNDIDVEKAKGRMLLRFMNTGRTLPLHVYSNVSGLKANYDMAKAYADFAEMWRSDAGKGREPKMIEKVENEHPKRTPPPPKFDAPEYGFGYGHGLASEEKKKTIPNVQVSDPFYDDEETDFGSFTDEEWDSFLADEGAVFSDPELAEKGMK